MKNGRWTVQKGLVYEGHIYDPILDSGRIAILTDEREYVYIEDALEQYADHFSNKRRFRVSILIEELEEAPPI